MKALYHFLILLALIFPNITFSQSYSIREGHKAFGEGLYNEAIVHYQAAIDSGSAWDWLPELQVTAEERRDMGLISPVDTHKIGVIFITKLQIFTNSELTILPDVTLDQKEEWKINFNLLKQILETFSSGNWTIDYDTISTTATYTDGALKPDNPDHLNLEDYWFNSATFKDSYITLSNTRSPAMGLARRYPYLNGEIYSPPRGMAAINAGSHGFNVLLHEFFHIVEWVSNAIPVSHGFEPAYQSYYPNWTPGTEFNYYKWHFSDTLSTVGWNRLNHRTRWIPFKPEEPAQDSLQSIYNSILLNDRLNADTLAMLATTLESSSPNSAADYREQALLLSPYHYTSLYELVDYYRFTNPNPIKVSEITDKLRLIRKCADYYTIDTINADYGEVIAIWHREDLLDSWNHFEWDITSSIITSECHEFRFYYTEGWNAIEMDSVELLENGVRIGIDDHSGFSGNDKIDIMYEFEIPAYNSGAVYSLKSRIKGSGGTDSYGQIHHKIGSNCLNTVSEIEIPKQALVYPNPTSGILHISSDVINSHWQLFKITGMLVFEGTTQLIDLSNTPSGVYVLLIDGNPVKVVKN